VPGDTRLADDEVELVRTQGALLSMLQSLRQRLGARVRAGSFAAIHQRAAHTRGARDLRRLAAGLPSLSLVRNSGKRTRTDTSESSSADLAARPSPANSISGLRRRAVEGLAEATALSATSAMEDIICRRDREKFKYLMRLFAWCAVGLHQ
jgi:hypothetical protein